MTAAVGKPPTIYRLRLRPLDSDSEHDAIRHLKALLKTLLRRHGFRCIELEQEQTPRA
jgi:hypothetical protein